MRIGFTVVTFAAAITASGVAGQGTVCGIEGERAREYVLQVGVRRCNGTILDSKDLYGIVHYVPPEFDRSLFPAEPSINVTAEIPLVLQQFPYYYQQLDSDAPDVRMLNFATNFKMGVPLGSEITINYFAYNRIINEGTYLGNGTVWLPTESFNYDPEVYGCKGRSGEEFALEVHDTNGDEIMTCTTSLRYFATQCDPGEYATIVEGYCKPAPVGSFGDGLSSSLCPSGSFANETGLDDCFPCEPGWFQSAKGQSRCNQCPQGQWQNNTGQAFCASCDIPCPELEYRTGCGRDSMGTCRPCSADLLASSTIPACKVVVPLDYGVVAGIVVGTLAFVSILVAPLYYKRRERIRRELREKERAIRELEAERQLEGNLGANVNPMVRQSGNIDTTALEEMNAEQAEKLGELSKELRTLKQERQINESDASNKSSRDEARRSAKKKEFQVEVVVPKGD